MRRCNGRHRTLRPDPRCRSSRRVRGDREARFFCRRIRRPAGTTQWEVTYNRHCHRHSLGKWFTMRCSKAMTSSNAARGIIPGEPVGGGDPAPADPRRPDRPRDANSSPGTRARFRRFNYEVSIDIRYVCEPRASPTHMRRDVPTLDEIPTRVTRVPRGRHRSSRRSSKTASWPSRPKVAG